MDKFFTVLRIIILVICTVLSLSFLNTMIGGLVNPGSVCGFLFCAAVIALIIVYPRLKKKSSALLAARICAGAMAAGALYCAVVSVLMLSAINKVPEISVQTSASEPDAATQTVIVLGCLVLKNSEPSAMLTSRLEKAVEYWHENSGAVFILCGGKGGNEPISEAECMKNYLLAAGIDENRLYTEDESANTVENILFAKQIMEDYSLPGSVVIISECYHLFRAVRCAKAAGLEAGGLSAELSWYWYTLPSYWTREILAITRDFLFGN